MRDFDAAEADAVRTLAERLRSDRDVFLPGLGVLSTHRYEGFTGRNPLTGAEIWVPARAEARFEWKPETKRTSPWAALARRIVEALPARRGVKVPKLGTFLQRHKKPVSGRNPATGERISFPARTVVSFSASPWLIRALNGDDPDAVVPQERFTELFAVASRVPFDTQALEALVAWAPRMFEAQGQAYDAVAPVGPLMTAWCERGLWLGELRSRSERASISEELGDGLGQWTKAWIPFATESHDHLRPAPVWALSADAQERADPPLTWLAGSDGPGAAVSLSTWASVRALELCLSQAGDAWLGLSFDQVAELSRFLQARSWPVPAFAPDGRADGFPLLRRMLPE